MGKYVVLILMTITVLFTGCNKKQQNTKENEESIKPIKIDRKVIVEEKQIEIDLKNPLELYKTYDFPLVEDAELSLFSVIKGENNSVILLYDGQELLVIDDIETEISEVRHYCIPYGNYDRTFSSAFEIYQPKGDDNYILFYGIIEFNKGLIKLYKWSRIVPVGCPWYSGNSKYYIVEEKWTKRDSYYDVWNYRTVPAVYGGVLLLIDIDTDETVYSIDKDLLYISPRFCIDKIKYEDDGFRITLGFHMDSWEFVDFKIFTENENFYYEICDKDVYIERDEDVDENAE